MAPIAAAEPPAPDPVFEAPVPAGKARLVVYPAGGMVSVVGRHRVTLNSRPQGLLYQPPRHVQSIEVVPGDYVLGIAAGKRPVISKAIRLVDGERQCWKALRIQKTSVTLVDSSYEYRDALERVDCEAARQAVSLPPRER
jgi:hypothetical protein